MTIHKPTVFIPIESRKREFDGKILLSAELLKRGFRVVLGTKSGVHREILYARNGLYLAKSASNQYLDLYRTLRYLGHKIAVLDVEGGALTREIKNDLLRSYQVESSEFFDYFYVFGDKIKEAMIRNLPYIDPAAVVVTGEPRFDLLHDDYDRYYRSEVEHISNRYGRYVLINTSFGLSNSVHGDEGIQLFLSTTPDIPDEQRPLYLLKHQEGKFLLQAFVSLARKIALSRPDLQVIIRPHPSEDPQTYIRQTEDLSNLCVTGEGNVHPWIKGAELVIHHDCTTGLEAVMARKPVVSYIPRMEEEITAWLPIHMSITALKEEEVMEHVRQILSRPNTPYDPGEERRKLFASYFINYSHRSSVLLADSIAAAYCELKTGFVANPRKQYQRMRSLIRIHRYQQKLKRGGRERFFAISPEEVREKLMLADPEIPVEKLKIKLLGGNSIKLEIRL